MILKECIELYEKEPEKYKGFTRKNLRIYFIPYVPSAKPFNKELKAYNLISGEFDCYMSLISVNTALAEDWEMLEVEPKVPEGFIKGYDGKYRKPCTVDVWVNVYWVRGREEIMTIPYNTKEAAQRYSYSATFIKTLRLSQQYSIRLEDIQ